MKNLDVIVKVAKVAGFVLPAIGALVGGWANGQEATKVIAETVAKKFDEANPGK